MSDLLFDPPESKSPRLLWMEKHGVVTHRNDLGDDDFRWQAAGLSSEKKSLPPDEWDQHSYVGYGSTEQEAIDCWAWQAQVRLWNEPTTP